MTEETEPERPLITRSRLGRDLRELGVAPGQTLMLHASVKSVGWIVGGPNVIIQALLDVLTPSGTLMMYAGWADGTYELAHWPEAKQRAYLAECPPFDPATARGVREWSILNDCVRTWPGARRSANPEASMVAVGAAAEWLVQDHPLQYGYGEDSPLAKLVAAGGKALLLGSPWEAVTLLHYSECVARVPNKRTIRYPVPVLDQGRRKWVEVEEYDTSNGIVEWAGEDYFGLIVREYLAAGHGAPGQVGAAACCLLDAPSLH
ncbi:MAG: aminoglycoside 3-N-acetyltransferase, partial [Actinomycetota bacterium]